MMAAMAKIWTVVLIFPSIDGRKPRKPGDDVDGRRADEDEHVAADDGDRHPERNGKMRWQRLRENGPHRQDDKRGDEHQLVGDRVEDRSEL